MLNMPYLNGGSPNSTWAPELDGLKTATYTDGKLNDPSVPATYWSVELALPFKAYVEHCTTATAPPLPGDVWRINFSRVEWAVDIIDKNYVKAPNQDANNWVWTNQHAINMHLPENWGFLKFITLDSDSTQLSDLTDVEMEMEIVEDHMTSSQLLSKRTQRLAAPSAAPNTNQPYATPYLKNR
eukprot:GFYU01013929.1.p1 GENE.GFYU01013929.1~~GFYU01013929.1.p1  ORF type:complete len:183 (+),score=46.98 GFYU01013929.1:197-745(+)